jgi:hypothetical protein
MKGGIQFSGETYIAIWLNQEVRIRDPDANGFTCFSLDHEMQ